MDINLNVRIDDIDELDEDTQCEIIGEALETVTKQVAAGYREGEVSVQHDQELYTGWWTKSKA